MELSGMGGSILPKRQSCQATILFPNLQYSRSDSSFYRISSKSMITGWIKDTIPNFRFLLKIPKTIIHNKHLIGVEREFIDRAEPILRVGKLGCLLIQLPPSFTFEKRQFEIIFRASSKVHSFCDWISQWFLEWNLDIGLLTKYDVANTITDSPIKFLSTPIVNATTHAFVRWHGHGKAIWYD